MNPSILSLEPFGAAGGSAYRTIFKNQHGRSLYLSLQIKGDYCTITNCFYTDRNQGRAGPTRYSARPKLLQTLRFPAKDLLKVIEKELDKHFYGVEFVESECSELSIEEYLQYKSDCAQHKYRFLIMVGEGESYNGLPVRLQTRLKTKLHRSVYVDLAYYKDGKGVVKDCHYYDRQYRRQNVKVTPPQLISCFFPYTQSGIMDLLNHEICCDFTHIIITSGIDIDSDTTPLCGAL